jgi:hypothetical protein
MEGFYQGRVEKCSTTHAFRDCVSALQMPGNATADNYLSCLNNYAGPKEWCVQKGNPTDKTVWSTVRQKFGCIDKYKSSNPPACGTLNTFLTFLD